MRSFCGAEKTFDYPKNAGNLNADRFVFDRENVLTQPLEHPFIGTRIAHLVDFVYACDFEPNNTANHVLLEHDISDDITHVCHV